MSLKAHQANPLKLPTIHLIGDEKENFYQLGLKDREGYQDTKKFIRKLIKTDNLLINQGYKIASELFLTKTLKQNTDLKELVECYAEGLNTKISELNFELIVPELMSCPSKFNFNLKSMLFGCSSLFRYDPKTESVYHGRILDFPLHDIFFQHERAVVYELKNQNKIFSLSVPGMPFPGITAFNDKGISVALHQKFSKFFNPEGYPIFYILYQLLKEADSTKSILKILKNYPSMTYWGLYISTPDGKVVALDLCGDRVDKEEFDIKSRPYLYFANRPIKKDQFNTNVIPYEMERFNQERIQSMDGIMKEHKKSKVDHLSTLELLSVPDLKHKKQTPLTLNSVQIVSMNAKNLEMARIAPHYPLLPSNQFEICEFKKKKNEFIIIKEKSLPQDSKYAKGYAHWMNAVSYFDRDLDQEGFHQLQMAKSLLESYPLYTVIHFYDQVYRYRYFSSSKDLLNLKKQFEQLSGKLPEHLENHRILYLLRVEKLLKIELTVDASNITSLELKKYFLYEKELNLITLKILKKLIYPKPDLEDIIYIYQG